MYDRALFLWVDTRNVTIQSITMAPYMFYVITSVLTVKNELGALLFDVKQDTSCN